ncbi:FG-GAP-like repeat-containing protein [Fluviispira multicolorata]|uniref:RHS repeat-associated protein n=1 Tax=Fluviispira multicolorata TaxID=2654512 RepID=A0A833JCB7_9BACT|nr:FG-GAP-like repeat-containing protein [Fluviispira multicolorata]KAB8030736.1 hypothetical protein GCL57_07120 [Fluviispira multicolorata]
MLNKKIFKDLAKKIINISCIFLAISVVKSAIPEVFSSPTLTRPSAPGKFGARSLDWSGSDSGEISYNILIQTPALRQLNINFNVHYSASEAFGEVGAFWKFNIPKIALDLKRGNTKYLSNQTCNQSNADNLYLNGSRLISLGNGTWASNLNSARNIVRCGENGFIFYNVNGEILHFGSSYDSQITDTNGQATEWYLNKRATFQGSQEIIYTYNKPKLNSQALGFKNSFEFISKPLLTQISADDINIKIQYEENTFKNPQFINGFAQFMPARTQKITVQKSNKNLRSYLFSYEDNNFNSFPRLSSVQETGASQNELFPKTIFSYRGVNSPLKETYNSINSSKDHFIKPIQDGKTKFADILGTGTSQALFQAGDDGLWLHSFDPSQIFLENNTSNLRETKRQLISFAGKVRSPTLKSLKNISFIDLMGTGVMDFFMSADESYSIPIIVINDRKFDDNGTMIFERVARFRNDDLNRIRSCDAKPKNWKIVDLTGDGKSDLLCIGPTGIHIVFNKGLGKYTELIDRYDIIAEKLRIPTDNLLRNVKTENAQIVDWNADGLPDILIVKGTQLTLYLNNGRLAKGERTGEFFERIELGHFPNIKSAGASQIAIGDFTGTGLPSIYINNKRFLINNGIGKPLTETYIDNAPSINSLNMAVVQFTGTGKQQIIASANSSYTNFIFELSNRSFPNLLHSVVTSDGRFLSFNYSSSVLENKEAIANESDTEIRDLENKRPLMPVNIPVLKQVGISDYFNSMQISRYAYRVPTYDSQLKKFLGFSLMRKQTVGDSTQAGTLIEQRFLSGYRKSESENYGIQLDFRLNSEKLSFYKGAPAECFNSNLLGSQTQWCAELSGYNYYKRTGAAFNDLSFATGKINTQENYTTERSHLAINYLNDLHLSGIGSLVNAKIQPAQLLREIDETFINGDRHLNYNNLYGKVTNIYDAQGRLTTKIKSNSPILNGDDLVTTFNYFCPMSHQENPKLFCDNIEQTQISSSLGSIKQTTQKVVYNNLTGLPIEEWSSTQNNELVLQASATYDNYARILSVNKTTGEKSFFEWDATNANLKSILDQDKIKITAEYNDFGFITNLNNSKGSITQFSYDGFGRILSTGKNLAGDKPLNINYTDQNSLNTLLNWFKSTFSISSSASLLNNSIIEFERYEYKFPSLTINTSMSLEDSIKEWNKFDKDLPIIPTAESYKESTLGKFINSKVTPGHITIFRRNNENEKLSLVSKIWLSGTDEALFSAAKIGDKRFSLVNKSKINSLGKIHTNYLNNEISFDDVLNNKLPDSSNFKIKSIFSFYSDGNVASEEFDAGIVQRFVQGVDFEEAISPEGRRTRKLFNQLGQVSSKQIGLDSNGNISQETLITNINYDAFGRISQISNNDGLFAMQSFANNGQVESITNNALGLTRYFYDNYDRLAQSALCPVGINSENCNILNSSVLYKEYKYNNRGKLETEEHTRFDREKNTNSKETIKYEFGSKERNSRAQDIGMPTSILISSRSELGWNESKRLLTYNREGLVIAEDLELFLGVNGNNANEILNKKSVGVYQIERMTDLVGNLVQLRTRGGFSREKLNNLGNKYFTGYSSLYNEGTSQLKKLSFLLNGKGQSVPLQDVYVNAQGYAQKIKLENNLELQTCWHNRKEVPLALWAGHKNKAPSELCDTLSQQNNGLFHSQWQYDKDLFPISSTDLTGNTVANAALSGNSVFSYDSQGRLSTTQGVGNEGTSWGRINYEYSVGGKINKVIRSGHFIKDRITNNTNSLIDSYSYSSSGQIGLLQVVLSTDGKETAIQKFASDSIGFRKFGVAPTLAVLKSDSLTLPRASSWKNKEEIPMHQYIWNGRGQLTGVFSATLKGNENNVTRNELLNVRMSDAVGGQLAEFDGVDYLFNNENKNTSVTLNKLARNVQVADGVSFERDEIHLNIDLGSFATLRLITRYPALNAASPETLSSADMLSRKELVIKDHVGSVSQVIDLFNHKIVERNASEPFGLARGIPLLSNSNLNSFKKSNKRQDISLYQNAQSNIRENWEMKSFEILGSTNTNATQGMRGSSVFATGKFSASTGLSSMGVRTLDSARGIWLSPDLHFGQNLDRIFNSPIEANLFQYSMNNPVLMNDPSGKVIPLIVVTAWRGYQAYNAYRTYQVAQTIAVAAAAVSINSIENSIVKTEDAAVNPQKVLLTKSSAIPAKAECLPRSDKNISQMLNDNRKKGLSAEMQVAREFGLIKNTQKFNFQGYKKGTIPDFIDTKKGIGVAEVKNTNYQSLTPQIKMELLVAKKFDLPFTLFIDIKTKVTGKLSDAIKEYNLKIGIKDERILRRDFNKKEDKNNTCEKDLNKSTNSNTGSKNDKDTNSDRAHKINDRSNNI